MKSRTLLPLAIATLSMLAAGCSRRSAGAGAHARTMGRPDVAWRMEKSFRGFPPPAMNSRGLVARDPLELQNPTNLNFHRTPAHEVITAMMTRFRCRITLTREASSYIHTNDVRITARAMAVPQNLAFEVLRGQMEAAGLVVQEAPNATILGRPHFLIDRSAICEATVPATL